MERIRLESSSFFSYGKVNAVQDAKGKLLCSPGLQRQHADLVLPANKNMPAHKKLITSAALPAHHKN